MAENKVSVELSIDEQKALRAITDLQNKLGDFSKKSVKEFGKIDAAVAVFAGNLASKAVTGSLSLIGDGFRAIANNARDFVNAANIQEVAVNDLNTALALTGQYSKQTSKDLQDYASELQNLTGVGDEVILSNQALIQNIARLSDVELKQATNAAIQLSAALGKDLRTSSELVAKAINGKTESLGRFGITIEKSSNQAEQFNNVIRGLAQFSGTAESKLQTFAGASQALDGRVGDLKESFGAIITQNPAITKAINAIGSGVQEIQKYVDQNRQVFIRLINDAFVPFVEIGGTAALIVLDIAQSFVKLNDAININRTNDQLKRLQEELNNVRESSMQMIDPNTGERIKTFNEQVLESEIKRLEGSLTKDIEFYNKKQKVFEDFGKKVKEIQTSITTALQEDNTKLIQQDDERFKKLQENALKTKQTEEQTLLSIKLLRDTANQERMTNTEIMSQYEQLKADENFMFLSENLGREEALREVARAEELSKTAGQNAAINQLMAARTKAEQNRIFAVQDWEKLSNKQRLDNLKATFGAIATLQSSGSRELFEVGKAAAVGQATIDGILAVQKALGAAPPPLNYALAATVGVATAANIAKIASQKMPKFESGGIVGGNSFTGDKITARVNSGEMILNKQQQKNLFNDINSGGSSGGVIEAINALGDRIAGMTIIVQANSREIARLVRDERNSGFAI